MPPVGKEIEPQKSFDELATREVEGYIDRVEKQIEKPADNSQQTQSQPTQQAVVTAPVDMGKMVAAQFAIQDRPNIVLPLNKKEIEDGEKHKVSDSIKWLSTWCIYMIKKYPGRVFYSPNNNQ